jgi:hypothetical protein
MSENIGLIILNIVVPVITGILFFVIAWFLKNIAPMRTLVTGELTYKWGFWGFIFFGIYFGSRPLQLLLGPYPMPLIVNCIREFFLIGLFAPSVFIAMMSLVYGPEKILDVFIKALFAVCITLALVFVVVNIFVIGGSEELFSMGAFKAYDGQWFANPDAQTRAFMVVLFAIRFLDPVLIIFLAGCIVFWNALHYPEEKKRIYDNMPKKLIFTALANFSFSISMLSVGILYIFGKIPNQWWIYYIGGLFAGIFEFISLYMPVKNRVNL